MFERFTDQARRVLVLAQEESRLLGDGYVGEEHILLGLLGLEGTGAAKQALESSGVTLAEARRKVAAVAKADPQRFSSGQSRAFSARAKRTLEASLREAIDLGSQSIDSAHLLLGLISQEQGRAVAVLETMGVDIARIRADVLSTVAQAQPAPVQTTTPVPRATLGHMVMNRPAMGGSLVLGRFCSFCGRDLWEVERYVTTGAATICELCVELARQTLVAAGPDAARELSLPPRVFGDAPDAEALDDVVNAFRMAFVGDPTQSSEALRHMEDPDDLAPYVEEASRRTSVRVETIRVDRIRFIGSGRAEVRFQLVLSGGGGFPFEGLAVNSGGRWLVSRETMARVLSRGGVVVPLRRTDEP